MSLLVGLSFIHVLSQLASGYHVLHVSFQVNALLGSVTVAFMIFTISDSITVDAASKRFEAS